jgi:hypothetical protein
MGFLSAAEFSCNAAIASSSVRKIGENLDYTYSHGYFFGDSGAVYVFPAL